MYGIIDPRGSMIQVDLLQQLLLAYLYFNLLFTTLGKAVSERVNIVLSLLSVAVSIRFQIQVDLHDSKI